MSLRAAVDQEFPDAPFIIGCFKCITETDNVFSEREDEMSILAERTSMDNSYWRDTIDELGGYGYVGTSEKKLGLARYTII